MRIINEITQQEITNPDLTNGELSESLWARPEAYASIDNVTKFALDDSDYEVVKIYHAYTEEEIAEREESERQRERQEIIDLLPDAFADLSEVVSNNSITTEEIMDAIADLSKIVSDMAYNEQGE